MNHQDCSLYISESPIKYHLEDTNEDPNEDPSTVPYSFPSDVSINYPLIFLCEVPSSRDSNKLTIELDTSTCFKVDN